MLRWGISGLLWKMLLFSSPGGHWLVMVKVWYCTVHVQTVLPGTFRVISVFCTRGTKCCQVTPAELFRKLILHSRSIPMQ